MLFRRAGWLLAAVVMVSCARGGQSAPAHVLRIADVVQPSSFDPLLAHDQDTIGYDLLIAQTLVGLDAHNRLAPVLITQLPTRANGGISADGRRIVYHLRKGVRFADGVELTSADVAFTYRAIMDPRNNVLSQDAYRRIASLTTPNRYTVVVRLKHRWGAAVSDLFAESDFAFGILPAHAFTGTDLLHAAWEQHPFASGPFRVKSWRRGDRAILVPNPYFSPKPRLHEIVLQMIPSDNSAFLALQAGEVDVAPLSPQMLAQARNLPNIRVLRTPENAIAWFSLQTTHPPADELAVRRAIAYALNMKEVRKAYQGVYPQAGSFLPPVFRAHDASIKPYPYNLARARALLDGRRVNALLVIESENPLWARIATVVQQQLARAGITVTIKAFPTALFNAPDGPMRSGRFTMALDRWIRGADPEQSIVFTCSQANADGDNISRFCDPAFERLFADQERSPNRAQRRRDFAAMQRIVQREVPVIPLYYETYFEGVNRRVSGFARTMLRYPRAPERWDTAGAGP